MAQKHTPISPDLLEMKRQLADWRSTEPTRSPLPDSLWDAIVKLARAHGLYQTAKTLPIDYGTLKRRLNRPPENRSEPVPPPSFLELIPSPPTGSACIVEMLRIESKGPVDWPQLLTAWRRSGA